MLSFFLRGKQAVLFSQCILKPEVSSLVQDTAYAEVAEWQTRYVQGVVSVRTCGFNSHLRHHRAPVAQRIERSPAEAEVVGSNLTRRTITGD